MKLLQSVAAVTALVLSVTALAIYVNRADPTVLDFATFYRSASAWRLGQPVYVAEEFANLNPPTTVLLLAPLSYAPLDVAFLLHVAIALTSVIAGLVAARQRLSLSFENWAWLGCVLIASSPAAMAWGYGQWQWWLFYPMTKAWLAYPLPAAGWWLGVCVAIKPPLALMAVLLQPAILGRAALGAISLCAITVPIVGWSLWAAWLSVRDSITWIGIPENASIWSLVARWNGAGWQLTDAHWLVWTGAGCLAVGIAWPVSRLSGSSRWVAAMLWHLAVSPVGWPSYLVLIAAPMISSWPSGPSGLGGALAVVGSALVGAQWAFTTLLGQSTVVVGVLALLVAWITDLPERSSRPEFQQRGQDG